ncbi:hypothetical protein FOZ60_013677 [Perkinsus olseni]|uniref:Uncharacterized protein n=1 Tax=Perkinsus olseni TaxID=32597 RepID=A0A7J6N965_PEROL|nr:hypothetical protein FOZ60_013677 [Perkinsus olseni]
MYLNGDDAEMEMLVKLVRSPDYEVETIAATTEVFPNLLRDPRCSVPFCIIDVVHYEDAEECDEGDAALRQEPNVLYHIHISRFESQCTVPLSDLLMKWWFNSAAPTNIAELCRSFGSFLAAFHRDYPQLNHGDMNPTNVLVGTTSEVPSEGSESSVAKYRFVLVDCGGMDADPSSGGAAEDMGTLRRALEEMGILYGAQFVALTWGSVVEGYRPGR